MPAVAGSDEPYRLPVSSLQRDASGKHMIWEKHVESFHATPTTFVATSAATSANSSPTTTASLIDDSSATEMSPGTSPESPMAKSLPSPVSIPLRTGKPDVLSGTPPSVTSGEVSRPATPGRRARNLKNLAVNTTGTFHMSRAASMTSLPVTSVLEESPQLDRVSRSFSKPSSPPKRRPANLGLTILTPANTPALPSNVRVAVPPTPSLSRPNMLRHFQSSPSLPLHTSFSKVLETPSYSVAKPGPVQHPGLEPLIRSDSSEPNFDIPLSKEEKPEAYPDGPICVYGPQLDLYLEPTADQALGYDVVINVASEVRNPFVPTNGTEPEPDTNIRLDGGGGIQYAPRRTQLHTSKSFQQEALTPVLESTPSTPSASESTPSFYSNSARPGPEYIHIPWEHNTDIVPDTLRLVKMIDDRISRGRKILIHCQCGVSRSATLVVAYVIYKNPTMSVQEAYDAVKKRSKWIGPNMNLIMQLQEFRTALLQPRARLSSSRGLSPISPSLPVGEWTLPGPHGETSNSAPKTAPLPAHTGLKPDLAINSDLTTTDPGPSSAPSGSTWPAYNAEDALPVPKLGSNVKSQDAAYVDPSGNVIPVLKVIEEPTLHSASKTSKDRPRSWNLDSHTRHDSHLTPQVSPRSLEFAMAPLQPRKEFDSADTFGLMSPTTSDFSHSPWDRDALLGSLGMGSAVQPTMSVRTLQVQPASHLQPVSSGRDPSPGPMLRPKMSAPSLQEQREFRNLQSELEGKLTRHPVGQSESDDLEAALMSPRVLEFTQNPFALESDDAKSAYAVDDSDDPRSPAQKGVSPITRNIFDVL